jgi:hypothetical protein
MRISNAAIGTLNAVVLNRMISAIHFHMSRPSKVNPSVLIDTMSDVIIKQAREVVWRRKIPAA